MDILGWRDQDIGPEFVAFLTEKLRTTTDALKRVQEENEQLRKDAAGLEEHLLDENHNIKAEGGIELDAAYACRAGICPSMEEVKGLKSTVDALEEKLKVQSDDHAIEISGLQDRLTRTKAKYAACRAELKVYRKEHEDSSNSLADQEPGPSDQSRVELDLDQETGIPIAEEVAVIQVQDNVAASGLDEFMRFQDATDDPNQVDSQQSWQELALALSLPANADFLSYLPQTVLEPSGEYVQIYLPSRCCTSKGPPLQWTVNHTFDLYSGKTMELFYKGSAGVHYIGTYQHDRTPEMKQQHFRNLRKNLREAMAAETFLCKGVPESVQKTVHRMYWDGTAVMDSFHLRRVGFNGRLYGALKTLPGPEAKGKGKGKGKRKAENQPGPPAPKKRKTH
ncbi:hypothetical protein NM688_g4263 [Phlebia brevispora]|uniref:Uncharacterized protein n=1 Tax=Phlebia brevispora TaxID=194682 RepID=A0ACC1T3J7_9APHY|nr:hypothetical protein NM688_g4263 [Phlebia brevispora]